MNFFRLISTILPASALVLVLLVCIVSNELAGAGKNTLSLDQTILSLQSQNELLNQQLATQTSLITIETKAKELGFIYSTSTIALTPPDVAYNRSQ